MRISAYRAVTGRLLLAAHWGLSAGARIRHRAHLNGPMLHAAHLLLAASPRRLQKPPPASRPWVPTDGLMADTVSR
jgi:hypothetical protein